MFLITLSETTAAILVFSRTERTKPLEEEEMGIFTKDNKAMITMR